MATELRHRKRDGDKTGLHRAEERDDVIQPLRSQYRRPITHRPVQQQFLGDSPRSPLDLRPRQTFGEPGWIDFVVNERIRDIIRLPPRTLGKHGWDCVLVYWHYSTFRYVLTCI